MNKIIKVIALISMLFTAAVMSGCHIDRAAALFSGKSINPSGDVTRVKKNFTGFSAVSVGSGFELIIKMGNSESVEIEANENLHQYIEAVQHGESIEFGIKNNVNFNSDAKVKIYITAKNLNNIEASGGSYVSAETIIKSNDLSLELSGGSELKSEINCNNLKISLSGGSIIDISGKCSEYNSDLSGGSIVKGENFVSDNLSADLSGGSIISIICNGSLTVNASGGSSVTYTGHGVIRSSDLSGGSEINKM